MGEKEEVEDDICDEQRKAKEEDEAADEVIEDGRGSRRGYEGRYAGACEGWTSAKPARRIRENEEVGCQGHTTVPELAVFLHGSLLRLDYGEEGEASMLRESGAQLAGHGTCAAMIFSSP